MITLPYLLVQAAFIHEEDMVPYKPKRYSEKEMESKSSDFSDLMEQRQSVRCFSKKSVPIEVIQNLVKTAGNDFVTVFVKCCSQQRNCIPV